MNARKVAEKYLFSNVFDDNMKIIEGLIETNGN